LPYPHAFIEPSEEGLEHTWALAFPDLPEAKARWLLESIMPEYRPTKDDPTREQEAAVTALRYASKRYRDLDLAPFQFAILFLDAGASGFLDPKLSSTFDWDALFRSASAVDLFFGSQVAQLRLFSDSAIRAAWLKVPLATRAMTYLTYPMTIVGLIETIEGISLPAVLTDDLWKALAKYPDRMGSLRELADRSDDPLDLSRLPTEEERKAVRGLYLRLLTDGSKGLVAALYDGLSFPCALEEIFGFIAESTEEGAGLLTGTSRHLDDAPPFGKDEPCLAAKICWDYLLGRLKGADPGEAFSFLSSMMPITVDTVVEYFGDRDASSLRESAASAVDALFREDVLHLVERSLRSTRGVTRRHDPFSRAIIDEIDSRLAGNPRSRMAYLYSLSIRWFDSMSSEHIPSLGGMKSLEPMVLESIKETGGISPLLCLEDYCDIDALQEAAWRDAIAMILARIGYRAVAEAVTVDERNSLFIRAFVDRSYSGPLPAIFSNPYLEYARLLFDREFLASLFNSSTLSNPEAQRLLSVAIALGVESASEVLLPRTPANRELPVFIYVAFALSLSSADGAGKLSSPDRLDELGLLSLLPLDVLAFLIPDKTILLDTIVRKYFSGETGEAHPSVSDFRMRHPELLFERGQFPYSLNPAAKRALFKVASPILARVAEEGVGDDAHIGLGLAELILYDAGAEQTFDPNFSDACKKAAQRWFDATRACARSGASWGDLPSPMPCLQAAVSILWKLKGPWPAVKQLLTLFRHVPVASIGSDLDPSGADLPGSWQPVAEAIHTAFDRSWSAEDGRALRAEMTHDLLDKLKPSKDPTKKALVEPDEDWRYAYVRAVADLGADPSDMGHFHHQVLDKCAVNDPSPRVRKAAATAAASLRTRTGWKAGSSKRMLLHAWWWIRQAHLISSGAEIDREAALGRRETETRI